MRNTAVSVLNQNEYTRQQYYKEKIEKNNQKKLNWVSIQHFNKQEIIETQNLDVIESYLYNIMNSQINVKEFKEKDTLEKENLLNILQFSLQYFFQYDENFYEVFDQKQLEFKNMMNQAKINKMKSKQYKEKIYKLKSRICELQIEYQNYKRFLREKPKFQCYYCQTRKYFKQEIDLDTHIYRRHYEFIIPLFPQYIRVAPRQIKQIHDYIIRYKIPLSDIILNQSKYEIFNKQGDSEVVEKQIDMDYDNTMQMIDDEDTLITQQMQQVHFKQIENLQKLQNIAHQNNKRNSEYSHKLKKQAKETEKDLKTLNSKIKETQNMLKGQKKGKGKNGSDKSSNSQGSQNSNSDSQSGSGSGSDSSSESSSGDELDEEQEKEFIRKQSLRRNLSRRQSQATSYSSKVEIPVTIEEPQQNNKNQKLQKNHDQISEAHDEEDSSQLSGANQVTSQDEILSISSQSQTSQK